MDAIVQGEKQARLANSRLGRHHDAAAASLLRMAPAIEKQPSSDSPPNERRQVVARLQAAAHARSLGTT